MRRRRGRPDTSAGLSTAGWLFAELALLLLVVAVGSEVPPVRNAMSEPAVTSTPTTTQTAPPTRGLSLTTERFVMPAVPDDQVVARFTELMTARIGPDAQVGLVLLFGVSTTGVLGDGEQVSKRLKGFVEPAGLPQLRTSTDIRPYIGSRNDAGPGEVVVELFLMNGPS
ncbi:hypothetical protein GCM10022243_54650 [Saccharothrix violaceirubra]|uniref:Uncharacterized protein n=1 Tax=Saccharothrix violaceirubra TaxID=413306 RepID=A0A7W7WXT1_9PSEU|nr:hypothetical protein [Saccharothrix violaceirubra]MBB4966978.1 hypothetical protein [Saccharothrix violaceirubra]